MRLKGLRLSCRLLVVMAVDPWIICWFIGLVRGDLEEKLSEHTFLQVNTIVKEIAKLTYQMLIIQPRWLLRVKRELSSMIIPHQCFNNSNLPTMPRCYPVVRSCACKNKNNRPNIIQLPLPTRLRTSIMSVHLWFKARILAIKFWIPTRALRAWQGVVLRKMRLIILWQELNPRKISNRCLKVAVVNNNNSQPTWRSISLKKN